MRIDGWEERMAEVIARHEAMPAEYGVSDCLILTMEVVEALTGVDPWAGERDYSSEQSALRWLAKRDFRSVEDAFSSKLGPIAQAFARRGDIGVVEQDGDLCGVVVLGTVVLGKRPGIGAQRLPRARLVRAFEVG